MNEHTAGFRGARARRSDGRRGNDHARPTRNVETDRITCAKTLQRLGESRTSKRVDRYLCLKDVIIGKSGAGS